jgi:hypothetical protein
MKPSDHRDILKRLLALELNSKLKTRSKRKPKNDIIKTLDLRIASIETEIENLKSKIKFLEDENK